MKYENIYFTRISSLFSYYNQNHLWNTATTMT